MQTANFILKFGKYKGTQFSSTPKSYQDWLLGQDWFNINNQEMLPQSKQSESFALVENGLIHTEHLSFDDATEMKERHARCFPNCVWAVMSMSEVKGMDKGEGILERHRRIYAKY